MLAPEPESEDAIPAPEPTKMQALRENTLRAAGAGFVFADSMLITSGLMAGENKIASAGLFGLTAGFVGTRYGNAKGEKQLEQIERRLGHYLRRQGVEIPKDPTTASLTKENGVIDHIESFLYAYPSQVMNAFYSMIGVQFARTGFQNKSKDMVLSGSLLIAGALAGLLISEKKPDPEHPPENTAQKVWSWIQEKPLRLTGSLFTANQFFLGKSAFADKKANPGNNSYIFKLLAVAGFVFGNTMMSLSSKSHGGGKKLDEKNLNELAETSCRVIAAQPKDVQDALLEHIAGFLATQANLQMTADEISKLLHEKIAEVSKASPQQAGWQARLADANNAPKQLAI